MPAILTPPLALRYLHELSTDLRAAAVLAADGSQLAGDPAAAGPARELLAMLGAAGADARELLVRVELDGVLRGHALVARARVGVPAAGPTGVGGPPAKAGEDAAALALAVGPHALLPLLRHDVAAVLEGLAGPPAGALEPVPFAALTVDDTPATVIVIDGKGRSRAPGPADFAVPTAIFAGTGLLAAGRAGDAGH